MYTILFFSPRRYKACGQRTVDDIRGGVGGIWVLFDAGGYIARKCTLRSVNIVAYRGYNISSFAYGHPEHSARRTVFASR